MALKPQKPKVTVETCLICGECPLSTFKVVFCCPYTVEDRSARRNHSSPLPFKPLERSPFPFMTEAAWPLEQCL